MLRIQEYTISDLKQCLCPGHWFQGEPDPITRHRALSHVNNPRAEGGDVALLVAYDGDSVVAHLGILPDLAFCNQATHKIGWLTAWWANPSRNYTGVGLMLLSRAFILYRGRLGASGFSEAARKVYDATRKFVTLGEREGINGFARLNLYRLLHRRLPGITKFRTALGVMDAIGNQYITLMQWRWRKRHALPHGLRVEYLPEMDSEADDFIQQHSSRTLARRGAKELNWIARYPWVLNTPLARSSSFHFSSYAENYNVFNIKIYEADKQLVAVLMVTLIDGHAIVPHCFHQGQSEVVTLVLAHFLITRRAERLTLYHSDLVEQFLALRFPWLRLRRRQRAWICSRECIGDSDNSYAMQDGDGDCAFTT